MDTRNIEAELAGKYHYKKLSDALSSQYRNLYTENIPHFLLERKPPLATMRGTILCGTYARIVVGDYGAFIEIAEPHINLKRLIIKPGQEYRIDDPQYQNAKYEWYTIDDGSDIKIYKQRFRVTYADYVPGMYYVSVHEVKELQFFD